MGRCLSLERIQMRGVHRLRFQFSRVHHHLRLQYGLSLYKQIALSLIEVKLIDKEFWFELFWWQHRVDQLNLKLS